MARPIWSGSISFGLVNIPVKVVTAVSDKDVRFHLLHGKDGARIKFKRVCPKHNEEVDNAEIVRGFEVARGQYVTFTDEELKRADPPTARTIEIEAFVALDEIDPAFYEKPYYLIPDKNANKAYSLLLAALHKSKKVGLARVTMREKEYLVAIRAHDEAILMETMHFADEVIPAKTAVADAGIDPGAVDKKQLTLAQQLIESLSEPFDITRFHNRHRERILDIVERKAAGEEIVQEPELPVTPKTKDILAALEESIKSAKKKAKAAA